MFYDKSYKNVLKKKKYIYYLNSHTGTSKKIIKIFVLKIFKYPRIRVSHVDFRLVFEIIPTVAKFEETAVFLWVRLPRTSVANRRRRAKERVVCRYEISRTRMRIENNFDSLMSVVKAQNTLEVSRLEPKKTRTPASFRFTECSINHRIVRCVYAR